MAILPHAFSVVCLAEILLANVALMRFDSNAFAAASAEFSSGFALLAHDLMCKSQLPRTWLESIRWQLIETLVATMVIQTEVTDCLVEASRLT